MSVSFEFFECLPTCSLKLCHHSLEDCRNSLGDCWQWQSGSDCIGTIMENVGRSVANVSRYKGWHKKCSDPSHRHKKVVKSNLIEVSLDTAKDVKMFSEYCVVPGQKICKYCAKFLSEIVNETKLLQLKHRADDIEESRAENDTSSDSPR